MLVKIINLNLNILFTRVNIVLFQNLLNLFIST